MNLGYHWHSTVAHVRGKTHINGIGYLQEVTVLMRLIQLHGVR